MKMCSWHNFITTTTTTTTITITIITATDHGSSWCHRDSGTIIIIITTITTASIVAIIEGGRPETAKTGPFGSCFLWVGEPRMRFGPDCHAVLDLEIEQYLVSIKIVAEILQREHCTPPFGGSAQPLSSSSLPFPV